MFFLICSVEDRGHLQVLARLSRLLAATGFLDELRSVANPSEARRMVVDYDAQLSA